MSRTLVLSITAALTILAILLTPRAAAQAVTPPQAPEIAIAHFRQFETTDADLLFTSLRHQARHRAHVAWVRELRKRELAAVTPVVTVIQHYAPPAPVNLSANQALGKSMNAAIGWSQYWPDLYALWMAESGWSNVSYNSYSGAFGIPQAVPYSKMPQAAWPTWAGGSADPAAQISWGLGYIAARYGDPGAAYAFQLAHGYY